MESYFITFRSVTFAQRGEQVLHRGGIRCTLRRTPRWMEERGCGYCLVVREHDGAGAAALLRQGQVPFRKVYLSREAGQMQEVAL